jgi:hypothetical protein
VKGLLGKKIREKEFRTGIKQRKLYKIRVRVRQVRWNERI